MNKNIQIPAFEITGCYRDTEQCDRQLATGSFSCVTMFLRLKRFSSYYLLNVYLPTGLCVIVSWTTFWIRLDIAPARVTLCKIFLTRRRRRSKAALPRNFSSKFLYIYSLALTTFLSIITKSQDLNAEMKEVSYLKALDVWMFTCITFVFLAILEYCLALGSKF